MVDFAAADAIEERTLELIARTIADRLHPRRVIVIGSRARGDARPDSDYDIVVEFEGDSRTESERESEVYALFPGRGWALNVISRVSGEIERCADDPGTVDWDIVREGKILYSVDPGYSLPIPGASRVRETPGREPESVALWLARANADLQVARLSMTHGFWDHVCFHAQQSAEKYLKALLVRQLQRPARTHELEDLLHDLRAVGPALPGLDADCKLLSPHATKTRYGSQRADERMARDSLTAAERIAAATLVMLRP